VPPRKDSPATAEAALRRVRVLERLALGESYRQIALEMDITPATALADGRRALAERAREIAQAERSAALELARLDAVERRVQTVMEAAADADVPDHELVLEAADRLAVISERRLAVAASLSAAGDTEQAVVADLARMPERLRTSAAGRVAVLLARHLDAGLPAASMTSVTRELRVTLEGLAKLAPDDREESVVDDLRLRRAKRLAGESEGTGS
jgi:hypothetical protein